MGMPERERVSLTDQERSLICVPSTTKAFLVSIHLSQVIIAVPFYHHQACSFVFSDCRVLVCADAGESVTV